MTHVSKYKLKEKDFEKLYTKFQSVIAQLQKTDSKHFLGELLSESEKIMLTKRFSAIVMFKKGCSVYRVAQVLHMSPSTAERMKLKFEIGAYKHIVAILNSKKELNKDFWDTIEIILRAGLPPMGKHRWKSPR